MMGLVNRQVWRADLALAFNTLLWGSTFVLIKRALDDVSALLFVAIRFSIATVALAWVYRRRWTWRSGPPRGGILTGVCLFGGFAFQTAGLRFTTPSRGGWSWPAIHLGSSHYTTSKPRLILPLLPSPKHCWQLVLRIELSNPVRAPSFSKPSLPRAQTLFSPRSVEFFRAKPS